MGRRKLGQPRVHRIIIMDQYSNEIESHELDEYGRLKKKIVNSKKPRSVSLLGNNTNSQGKLNQNENSKHPRATLQLPHNFLELQNAKNSLNSEISLNSSSINPVQNSSESCTPSLISPSNIESKINQIDVPQPKFLPPAMEGISLNISNKSNHFLQQAQPEEIESINSQTMLNSIPIPMVMPQRKNNRLQINSNQSAMFPLNPILFDISSPANKMLDFSHKYYKFQTIFEIPDEPSIPLFIAPDE